MRDIREVLASVAPQCLEGSTKTREYVMIRCPFHSSGEERTPSCSVARNKPVFFCFGCHASGHYSQLLKRLGAPASLCKALVGDRQQSSRPGGLTSSLNTVRERKVHDPYLGRFILDEDLLDVYRLAPSALMTAGFHKDVLRHFEVGLDRYACRMTFPLRNLYGDLVGVSGRTYVDEQPRYKVYTEKDLQLANPGLKIPTGYTMEEIRGALLWHAHVVQPFLQREDERSLLVVTEGFKACMWVYQSGFPSTVALVGSRLTKYHAGLIPRFAQDVVLFLDNNDAGIIGQEQAARLLIPRGVQVWIAKYPDERQQPDQLTTEEVNVAIAMAIPYIRSKQNAKVS